MAKARTPRGGWVPPGPSPDQTWEEYLKEFPDPKPKRRKRKARRKDAEK